MQTNYWHKRWLRSIEEEEGEQLSLEGERAKLFWAKLLAANLLYTEKKYKKKAKNYKKRYGDAPEKLA